MEIPTLDEEEMQMIYNWVDEIPLSRPKRNIARDFSDGGNYYMYFKYNTNKKMNYLLYKLLIVD